MDVESLYTNVPVLEAINIAADKVYVLEEKPSKDKSIFMQLIRLAVTDIKFLACGECLSRKTEWRWVPALR